MTKTSVEWLLLAASRQPLVSLNIPSGECLLYPNTGHSDVRIC